MRRIILLVLTIVLSIGFINAQNATDILIGGCDKDYGKDAVVFPDGSKYLLSNSDSYTNDNNEHILITKLDSANNHVWSKVFYDSLLDIGYRIKKHKQHLLIVGTTRRILFNAISYYTILMQIDTSGQFLWSKRYNIGVGYGAEVCSNNDILITGVKENFPFPDGMFVIRTDTVGNVRWAKDFTFRRDSEGQDIIELSGGNIIVTGHIGHGTGTGTPAKSRPALIKLDSNGNVLWKKYYLFNLNPATLDKSTHKSEVIELSVDSNLITHGTYMDSASRTSYLLKINSSNGNIMWHKTYDFGSNDYSSGVLEYNNSLYINGNATPAAYYDMLIVNTDLLGNVNWAHSFGHPSNSDKIEKLFINNDRLALFGSSNNYFGTSTNLSGEDAHYFEVDSNGRGVNLLDTSVSITTSNFSSISEFTNINESNFNIIGAPISFSNVIVNGLVDTTTCLPVGVNSLANSIPLKVFPNPNSGAFTLELLRQLTDEYNIQLFTMQGAVIPHTESRSGNRINIRMGKHRKGIFLLKISTADKIETLKIHSY